MGHITGLHHVSMKTRNADEHARVVHFYRDTLGLRVARTWDGGIMFDTGNGLIEVFENGTGEPEQGIIRHFAFAVDDVDACAKDVAQAGYPVFLGPKDIEIPSSPVFPARIAFCTGPLNEQIELFEEK